MKKVHGFNVIEVGSSLAVLRHRGNTDSDIGESRLVNEVERVQQFLKSLAAIEHAIAQSEELMGLADDAPVELVAPGQPSIAARLKMSEELRRVIRAHVREHLEQQHRQMRETLSRLVQQLNG
nr:hypothetical protein [Gammaproteobacteria bacterium]